MLEMVYACAWRLKSLQFNLYWLFSSSQFELLFLLLCFEWVRLAQGQCPTNTQVQLEDRMQILHKN